MMYLIYLLLLCGILSINRANELSSSHRPSVAIVCFVKNNADILPFWLQYHVSLVGIGNIVVLDNFSSEKSKTPEILRSWQRRGLKVEWGQGPYSSKGELTFAAFKKHFPKHQIGVPLDIDEIIFGYGEDKNPNFKKSSFNRAIQKYWQMKAPCLAMNQYLQTCSKSENETLSTVDHVAISELYNTTVAKKIFLIDAAENLDHGNHYVFLKQERECVSGANILGLIHYHFRNPRLTMEHAIEDLHGFGYLPDSVTTENVKDHIPEIQRIIDSQQPGFHKAIEVLVHCTHGWRGLVSPCEGLETLRIGTPASIVQSVYNEWEKYLPPVPAVLSRTNIRTEYHPPVLPQHSTLQH